MENWMKRGLSLLLVLAMVVGFVPMGLPVQVNAAQDNTNNLQDAAGIVWLVKAESGAYAPASTELINMLMGEQLDDMIRGAVGKDSEDNSVQVKYNGMNVGKLSDMTANFQQLNAMRTEIVDAISDHSLVTFNIGGKDMKIAFRNYANAGIVFGEDGKLFVEAGEAKPANLAALRELVKATLKDVNKVAVSHNGKVTLEKAGATYKVNVKNAEWPEAGEEPVKIGTVTVSLIPDDVTTAKPVTAEAEVYIRDSRNVHTVTYQAVANGKVYGTETFYVYHGGKTPAATVVKGYDSYTWDKTIEKTVTGDVVYTANLSVITVTYYKQDGAVLESFQVPDGAPIPTLENDPYKNANGFKGWYQKEAEGVLEFYPAFTENHVATLYYNDRGTEGVLRFEIKNGKVDPAIKAYAQHPAAGVSTVGFIMEDGSDFDPDGNYNSDIVVRIIYFTDENDDGVKDGTTQDPRYIYEVLIGKLNADEDLVYEIAEIWTLEEKKYETGELATLPEIEYNPVYIGYAVDKWVVTLEEQSEGTYKYVIKPQLLPDTNGNGIADKKEGTKLVINAPAGCTVTYRVNDEGEYEAVVSYKIGGNTIESVIQISGLADDGWFMYQEGATKVTVSPAKHENTVLWYVDDVKLDDDSIVAGYDKNYNAYNQGSGAVVADLQIQERVLTIIYKAVPQLKFDDNAINAGFDPFAAYEDLEKTLYETMVADSKPVYEADKVRVWYLSRNLSADQNVSIQLDGLKAYIETHYGAVLDLLPEGMEFPETLSVTLPAKQWTPVEESPERHNASAQAIADAFINRKIQEMENAEFSPDQLMTLAAELVSELTGEVERKALLNPFGTMYADGAENMKVEYTTVKYQVACGPAFVVFADNRTAVELDVVKDHVKFDYATFTDADLMANVSLMAGGVKVTDAQPELDRVGYYENMDGGKTYTVTVSFSGNNKYKAAQPVTFALEIEKVTPQVQVEELVITADDHYSFKPVVDPSNAPIIQIIAGIESSEFALTDSMTLKDGDVTATIYVKIPQVYAEFLDGQQLDGYPVVEMGKFYTREQLVEALEEYSAHNNLPGKDAVNSVHAILDMIPGVLDSLEPYDMGLKKLTYKVCIDSIKSQTRPTNPGIYVNYAASLGYIGKFLEAKGNQYASLFLNDNYILSDLPGFDLTKADNLLALATLKGADYGFIVYTPMIPIPNNGGVQLYDGQISNAQNVFEYNYAENTARALEVSYNGEKLNGAEPYYYGLTTRLDATTAVPTQPGVYIAAYTYTQNVPNAETGALELKRIGSDAALIIIKPTEATLTITGGSFEYDGENKLPQIIVRDKDGDEINDANVTIISGTVNVKTQGGNVTANDLYGAVNIDFPNHWTIPTLDLPGESATAIEDAWNYYRTTFLNKAANDKFTPSDMIAFLEFCAKKTLAASDKAMELFEKIGANEYVKAALDKINNQVNPYDLSVENLLSKGYTMQDILYAGKANYFDALVAQLRPLEKLDDNVWITLQDLEDLDYSATGVYLYMGVITDPDLTMGAGKGVVIIHSADDYVMHDTYVPYDGQEHTVLKEDTTTRSDAYVVLDRVDEAKVAVSTDKKQVHIQLDEELAQIAIEELNKILAKDEKLNLQMSLNSGGTVGAAYVKTEKIANKLTDRVIASVRARAEAKLQSEGMAADALNFALNLLDDRMDDLYAALLAKLQAIDTLDNDTRIVISDMLPVDLGTYDVATFNFNTDKINFVLDEDLFGFIKNQMEKEGYTLNKGSNGYVVTGYQKGEKVAKKVTEALFDKIAATANAIFDKTPYETPAELTAALDALNAKLQAWETALLDKVQQLDNLDDNTLIVINGKLPVEVGTYDFFGYDYDVARTSATLVIEPVYIEIIADNGDKYYGTVEDQVPGATVNYYSYKTNPETLVRERVPYTNEAVIAAANLSYEVVVEKNAALDKTAPVGTYTVTIENVSVTESERYATPVTLVDGEYEVIPTTFSVAVTSEHTYDTTEQTVQFIITDNMTGEILDPALFDITEVTKATDAEDYYFTVTAKANSGHTGSVEDVKWTIQPAKITEVTATDLIYNGTEQTTTLVVKAGDLVLTENGYTVAIGTDKGTDAGDYTVTVSGTGNFTGSASDAWVISPAQITEVTATDLVYNGTEQTTTLVVKAGDLVLTENDYTVTGNAGTDVATYTVKVEGKGNFAGSAETTWDITPLDITDVVTTDKNYNGSEQTTDLTVTAGTLPATYDVVSGASATNAGTYTVNVKGTGNFSGELETTWTIHAADFTVEVTEEYTYNRQEQNAQFVIKFNGQEISKDDFVITGVTAATNVGEYSFTVTAKAGSNYKGTYTVDWKIVPAVIDSVVATNKVYNGETQTTTLVVKAGDLVLNENEYTVTGNTGKDVDEYTVTVTGKDNFAGSEDAKWNITPAQISSVEATDVTYNGQQQTAQLVVKAGELVLTENDYTVTGNIGTNAGDYTVTVTGKGNFTDSATDTWTISPALIDSVVAADLVYNNAEQTTALVVKSGEMTLSVTDYTVISGNKGTNAGDYTVQVQGKGNFAGIVVDNWTISPAQITSVEATDVTYNGQQQTAQLVVKAGDLVVDTYTVTGNVGTDAGEYTVTVSGTGNFAGNATDKWTVSAAKITEVTATDLVYNGQTQTTTLVVKAGDLVLDAADYAVAVGTDKGTDAGDYTVTVNGTGNFAGATSDIWTIEKAQITSVVATNTVYNDAEQTTSLTVTAGTLTATYNVVSGASATNAGTYTVKVEGTGNFTGTAEAEWKITPAAVKVTADDKTMKMNESIPALTYTVENVSGYVDPAKLTVDLQHTVPAPNSAGQYLPGDYEITVTAGSTANWTVEVVNGKLTVEAIDFICWNVNTGVYYDDVSDALAVASAGDVIQMLKDATATYNGKNEAIIVVGANVTFDLYGHYVETDNLLSFGAVIDTVATAAAPDYNTDSALVDGGIHSGGIVIDIDTTKAWTQLQPANAGYIPVYDTETSSYKFFVGGDAGEFNGAGGAIDAHDLRGSDGVNLARFRFRLLFKDAEAYQILGRTDDSGMKVVLNIKWSGLKAMDVTHTMGAAGVKNHATQQYPNRGTVMYFYIYDLSGIGDSGWISAQPTIVTQAGVVDVARDDAAVYTHTWGNA